MSLRLACSGGRPRLPPGSSGPSTAHCASVRYARPVTAKVATRSPCRWSSLSLTHLPETSSVTGQRHAGISRQAGATQSTFETRSSPQLLRMWEQEARKRLRDAFDQAFGGLPGGVAIQLMVVRAPAGPALIELADQRDDLLVVGYGGRSRLGYA